MTKAERRIVEEALRAKDNGYDGLIAKGSRRKVCERLFVAGLLRYVGHGIEEDGTDREFPIYEATEAGKAAVT